MEFTTVKASYFDDFKCIADKCRTNCCQGWTINISKSEYTEAKNSKCSPELKEKFNTYYKRDKHSTNSNQYAKVTLDENGGCPFLNKGLCSIQSELGYSALSRICKTYPRATLCLQGVSFEKYCELSCEAVVELLMNLSDGFTLNMEVSSQFDYIDITRSNLLVPSNVLTGNPVFQYYWDIRIMCINLLQNRALAMSDRVIHLGLALQKLDELNKSKRFDEIPALIDTYNNQVGNPAFAKAFAGIETNPVQRFISNCNTFNSVNPYDIKVLNFCRNVKENYGVVISENENSFDKEKLDKAYENMADFPHFEEYILENLTVNLFLTKMFPFNNFSIWENYMLFCRHFSMMKFCIAGNMGDNPTKEKFIDGVVMFARQYLHTSNLEKRIIEDLNKTETNTLAHMAIIVK